MNLFIIILIVIATSAVAMAIAERKNRKIICPNMNCCYRGMGKVSGGKSLLIFILLLFLGIIPGLIYLLWPHRKSISCPQCGLGIR